MVNNSFFHKFCPPNINSKYSLIVFDHNAQPFLPLTDYYVYLNSRVSSSTALQYISVLEPFFYWLTNIDSETRETKVSWKNDTIKVQKYIHDYLFFKLNCKVRDQNDYEKIYITKKSSKTTNVFLASIKRFYKFAIEKNLYPHTNPLIDITWNSNYVNLLSARVNKPRLYEEAGTEEKRPIKYKSNSYFKLINDEWKPEIVTDINLPYKLLQAAEEASLSLRDTIIIRLLFETGARISEVLELTIGDYNSRNDNYEIAAINKGSFQRRTKYLKFSSETLKLIIRYINTSRYKNSLIKTKFNQMMEDEYIFISKNGTKYTYSAFMNNWYKLVDHLDIKLTPHKIRHWFVTNMLRIIYEEGTDSSDIEIKKKLLIDYMKWKDRNIIDIYEHYFDTIRFAELYNTMIERTFNKPTKPLKKNKDIEEVIVEKEWVTKMFEDMEDE